MIFPLQSAIMVAIGWKAGSLILRVSLQVFYWSNARPEIAIKMRAALETLESGGLEIQVAAGSPNANEASRAKIQLEISGPDHPGIVQDISHFLAERNINIIEMQSHVEEAAMSGGYIFHSTILSSVPASQQSSEIENALDDLASTLNIEITLDDLKGTRTRI